MNTINKQPERHEIEALLPWHAAGTLSRRDADRVEQALAGGRELARRYDLVREELAETIHLNETLGAPSARAMEKLFARDRRRGGRARRAASARSISAGASRSSCRASLRAPSPGRQPPPWSRSWCRRRLWSKSKVLQAGLRSPARPAKARLPSRALPRRSFNALTRSCRSTAWSRGLPSQPRRAMSAIGGRPADICSLRGFRILPNCDISAQFLL